MLAGVVVVVVVVVLLVAEVLLPPQPVSPRPVRDRVSKRPRLRPALSHLRERRRTQRNRNAPARVAGRGSCFQGDGRGWVELLATVAVPGRAAAVVQAEELVSTV